MKQIGCLIWALVSYLIDLVKSKAVALTIVTFLVMDEADRMFDMGFGELSYSPYSIPYSSYCQFQDHSFFPSLTTWDQIVRVSNWTIAMVTMLYPALLFSTFHKEVEKLCWDILTNPVTIVVGTLGEVLSYCTLTCYYSNCAAQMLTLMLLKLPWWWLINNQNELGC